MTDDLPQVHEAVLDDERIDDLFRDVAHAGQLLEVVLKGGAEARAGDPDPSAQLSAARIALRERRVFGVQLRYLHGGTEWWDTLIAVPGGARLVRIDRGKLIASQTGDDEP